MNVDPQTSCYVHRIATAVPERWLDQEQSGRLLRLTCRDARSAKLSRRILRLSGIEKRHLAALDFQSELGEGADQSDVSAFFRPASEQPYGPGMGARTTLFEKASGPLVRRALAEFPGEALAKIHTLITVSCTHASSPGLERPILKATAVPPSVDRWNLGFMGCSGGLAAMRLRHRMARHGQETLILACELCSLHFQYTDRLDQMTANALFADGAAAMVLSPRCSADKSDWSVRVVGCACASFPASADQMVWFAGDHGLSLELSRDLPDTLAAVLPGTVSAFLGDHGISISAIDHWLVHPGGPQILDSVEQSLGLPEDALQISRSVLTRYGNMSSPTIFFIMKELFETKSDGRVLAMAFGPGLTIELVLLHIDHANQ